MVTVVTMATRFALIDTEGPTLLVGLEFLTHREATEGAGLVSVSQSRSFNPQRIKPTTLVLQEQPELQAEQSVSDQLNNQRLLFLPLRTLSFHLTCGDKQDARAEDDVVAWLVELAGGDAQPSHEEQDHTQDGEDTGGPYGTWTHVEEKNHYHNYHPGTRLKIWLKNCETTFSMVNRLRRSDVGSDFSFFLSFNDVLWLWVGEQIGSFVLIVSLFYLYQISLLHYAVTVLSIFPSPPLLPYQSVHQLSACSPCAWLICWLAWGSPWRCSGHGAWCGLGDHQCHITELLIDFLITVHIPAYSAAKMIQLKQICN